MNLVDHLKKPEYLFRPSQVFVRIWRGLKGNHRFETVRLPWGLEIKIQPDNIVGHAVWTVGVADPTVSEVLWRLIEPAETVVDVGANIGCLTGLMAARVGNGKVIAFEPSREVFTILRENVAAWRRKLAADLFTYQLALSNYDGAGVLGVAEGRARDTALAGLIVDAPELGESVQVRRLAGLVDEPIGVLKIDVEGHERAVLEGAAELIRRRLIRDIVFEDHQSYPTPAAQFLEAHGYELFNLGQSVWGPKVTPIRERGCHRAWDSRSCLATLDAGRALTRLHRGGWETLSRRARRSVNQAAPRSSILLGLGEQK